MIKDIDFYFDPTRWVIPESIYSGKTMISNSGLRVKADFLNPNSVRFWGDYYESWNTLGIYHKNEFLKVDISTENLLKVIQYCGISEQGYLNGTFKLSRIPGKIRDIFRLIPEDSRENLVKSEISKVYFNPGSSFTRKMIPGHLYVSKSGDLFLCVKNRGLDYSYSKWFLGIDSNPKPKKILVFLNRELKRELDRVSPKTLYEFANQVDSFWRYVVIRSYEFSGKDLGQIVLPDELGNLLDSPKIVSKADHSVLLFDELWKTNNLVREELKKRIKNFSSPSIVLDPNVQMLRDELGI